MEYETLVETAKPRRAAPYRSLGSTGTIVLGPERNGRSVETASWRRVSLYTTSTKAAATPWLGELSELTSGLEGGTAAGSRP